MYRFLSKKLAASCVALGLSVFSVTSFAAAEVFLDTQILSTKQQWRIAGMLSSPKAVYWLNDGMNRQNGVPSKVTAIDVVSFDFNQGAKEKIASLSPVPFDKIGVIVAYATLMLENGQKDGGIILIDDPGKKEKVRAYWISAQKIAAFLKAKDHLKSGGQPLPAFRGPVDFEDPEVNNCVAQSFLVRPVGDEDYPYQRWVRCTNKDVRQEILTPKTLVPAYNG